MSLKLSDKQILNYKNDGVILIKEVFLPWIEKLKNGFQKVIKVLLDNASKAKSMIKNLIYNFDTHIDLNDPTNNCLDVAIITAPEKRSQKTKDKLKTVAGRVLIK